jgi:hypothetical protein
MSSIRSLVLMLGAVAAPAAIASVTVSDADFNPASWDHTTHQFGVYGGSGSVNQTSNGLNGTGWQINNSCGPSYSGAWNASVYLAFSYNPSVGGPLTDLAFSIDTRYSDRLQAVSFIVEQDGHRWRLGYYINQSYWTSYQFSNPVDTDFAQFDLASPLAPNLVNGSNLRFGIAAGNSSAGGWGYDTTGYYDNFQVTFVPSPAAALVLLSLARSRRR